MATSTKVLFNLETLKTRALEAIDLKIEHSQQVVDSYDSDEALKDRVTEWREQATAMVQDLAGRLSGGENEEVGDYELSKFKVPEIPSVTNYDRRRAQNELHGLQERRALIVAKTESLVGDENGNISLTKTQLQEFFGL